MGTIQISGLIQSKPTEDVSFFESSKIFSSFDTCKKIEIRKNYELDSQPISRDRYVYEPIIEIISIIILYVGFISLRMFNKAAISTIIVTLYSCYGIWIATFLLALYDSSVVGNFAQDKREILVGLAGGKSLYYKFFFENWFFFQFFYLIFSGY